MGDARAMTAPDIYDPLDPETNADPYPLFRRLRLEDPVHYSEPLGGFMVTGYANAIAALREPALSSDRITPAMEQLDPTDRNRMSELERSLASWAVFADPPAHTRLRALFNKAFSSRMIEGLALRIRGIVDELISEALEARSVDFITAFAYPLPTRVICAMLGLPEADIGQIRVWSDDVATFIGLPKKPRASYESALTSNRALSDYFRGIIAEHRQRRPDDLVTHLIEATESGDRLSEDELLATCNLLLFAAHTTTTHLLGNGMLALLRHPEARAGFEAAPESMVATAVEELLRYDGPIQAVRRRATREVKVGGRAIATGDLVFVMINAANRDPAVFADPEALDLRRVENRHIAFGFGPHFCSGAPLARLEARLAFESLLSRCRFELLDASGSPSSVSDPLSAEASLRWTKSFGFRGVARLPLRITPREARA